MLFKYHTGCIPAFLLAKIDSSEIFLILYVFIFFPPEVHYHVISLVLMLSLSSVCVLFDFKCPQTLKSASVADPWYFGSVSTDDVKCKKCLNEFLSLGLLLHIKVIIPSWHTDIGGLSRDLNYVSAWDTIAKSNYVIDPFCVQLGVRSFCSRCANRIGAKIRDPGWYWVIISVELIRRCTCWVEEQKSQL